MKLTIEVDIHKEDKEFDLYLNVANGSTSSFNYTSENNSFEKYEDIQNEINTLLPRFSSFTQFLVDEKK